MSVLSSSNAPSAPDPAAPSGAGRLDVCFINPLPVLRGFPWERHAPAWLLEPGWSPALPGEDTGAGLTKWTSSDIEASLETEGRELLRLLLHDHVDNRGSGRVGEVVCGADGVVRSHKRDHMEIGS